MRKTSVQPASSPSDIRLRHELLRNEVCIEMMLNLYDNHPCSISRQAFMCRGGMATGYYYCWHATPTVNASSKLLLYKHTYSVLSTSLSRTMDHFCFSYTFIFWCFAYGAKNQNAMIRNFKKIGTRQNRNALNMDIENCSELNNQLDVSD